MREKDQKPERRSAQWLSERAASVQQSTYNSYRTAMFETSDEPGGLVGCLAAVSGVAAFVLACVVGKPTLDAWDNSLLNILFSFVAAGIGFSVYAAVVVVSTVMVERQRERDAARRGWARTVSTPIAGSARTAVVLTLTIVAEVRQSPAWTSELLETTRGRPDLSATVDDVVERAKRIDAAMASLPAGHDSHARSVRSASSEHLHAANSALDALVDRVRALDDYLGELRSLEKVLAKIARIERELQTVQQITDVDTANFESLYRDAGISEWNARETRAHANELAELRESLQSHVKHLQTQATRGVLLYRE